MVDPFAGGGSIPLEALRLGCEAFASDLNPVACLILKVMLEDIPRYGNQKVKVKRRNGEEIETDGLAEALRIAGEDIREAARKNWRNFIHTILTGLLQLLIYGLGQLNVSLPTVDRRFRSCVLSGFARKPTGDGR